MNPFSPSIFSAPFPCVCCGTPTECGCALLLPLFSSPYASYAAAAAVLADANQVVDCYGYYFNSFGGSITSLSVDVSVANQVTWDAVRSSPSEFGQYLNVTLKAGDTLALNFSGTMHSPASPSDVPSVSFVVYDCSGNVVYSDVILDTASGTMSWSVSADGTYYVLAFWGACVGTPACGWSTGTAEFTSGNLVVNPVIALWDDSGTTRQLEACPKMLLPALTESDGTWYADCASAAAVLSDPLQVSNCVGWCAGGPGITGFTATDGGSSLSFSVTGVAGTNTWGSINCEAGETISVDATVSTGTASVVVEIYDYSGVLVDSTTATSPPWTSAALPYTGRYILRIVVQSTVGSDDTTSTVTSSGALSVNQIQALWDSGLSCPARLNCGDSCP